MKSEERHQLAQNDLQVGLNRWLDRIEPYSNHILGGVVVATIVAVGLILWSRSTTAHSEEGWLEMTNARTAEQFRKIADDNPGTAAANWATLQAARISYSNGIDTALTDRKSSDESLKEAKELYSRLLASQTEPELREESLKGLALTLESLSGSDLNEAIKAYETLVKEFPNSPFKGYAEFRIADLKKPQAGEFYAWFRKQNPKPAERPLPSDGKSTLDAPLKTPELPDLGQKADSDAKKDAPPPALPAAPGLMESQPQRLRPQRRRPSHPSPRSRPHRPLLSCRRKRVQRRIRRPRRLRRPRARKLRRSRPSPRRLPLKRPSPDRAIGNRAS